MGDEALSSAIALSTALRGADIRVQLYTESRKFKAKMQYADRLAIPYVIFLGEDEIAEGRCSVKELATGQQQKLSPNEAIELIRAGLAERSRGSVIRETI